MLGHKYLRFFDRTKAERRLAARILQYSFAQLAVRQDAYVYQKATYS